MNQSFSQKYTLLNTMKTVKQNVAKFNDDVAEFGGYEYSNDQATYSSIVANGRINDAIVQVIDRIGNVRSVLDAGCGDGSSTAELKERLPQIDFTGFDPASNAIELAMSRFPSCSFRVGDALDTSSFPVGRFDLVLFRGVLHHLPDLQQAIDNAARVTDCILIIEPNGNNPILKWIEKHREYHIEHEEQSFASRHLQNLCLDAGLEVRHLSFVGFVPFFFPTFPARVIHFFQPFLEHVPGLAMYFGAQIVLLAQRATSTK